MSQTRLAIDLATQSLESKYAVALFRAAVRNNAFRQVEAEISRIRAQLDIEGDRAKMILESPLLSNSKKHRYFSSIISKSEPGALTSKFLDLIGNNGRLSRIFEILDSFDQISNSQKQCSNVTIVIAKDISKPEKDRLISTIGARFGESGRMLKFIFKVDQSLLGGMVIEIDDKQIDLSVKSRLSGLLQ